jgi:signal transduction histidine kinase
MLRLLRTSSFRLAAAYGLITALAFLILFFLTYWAVSDALDRQIRADIRTELVDLIEERAGQSRTELAVEVTDKTKVKGAFRYLLSDEKGVKLAGNFDATTPFKGWRKIAFNPNTADGLEKSETGDDDNLLLAFGIRLSDGAFLMVGQNYYRVLAVQEAITVAFAWAASLALAFAILAGLIVSRQFLKRIDRINATTNAIIEGDLHERIPITGTSSELDRVAANLNAMLDKNQSLMESLKQVSSSIAHDLRTPLTRLRQSLEEARLAKLGPMQFETFIDQAASDTDGILATFSALLRIAHIESGSRRSGFKSVDLSSLADGIVEAYRPVAEDEKKTLQGVIEEAIHITGDEELLTQMLANLVENAIKHTPEGSAIRVSLMPAPSGAVLEVRDNGPGIPEQERQRVFERFYRLDRSRSTPGDGLGLALVAAVAELHRVSLRLESDDPGLRISLVFSSSIDPSAV